MAAGHAAALALSPRGLDFHVFGANIHDGAAAPHLRSFSLRRTANIALLCNHSRHKEALLRPAAIMRLCGSAIKSARRRFMLRREDMIMSAMA